MEGKASISKYATVGLSFGHVGTRLLPIWKNARPVTLEIEMKQNITKKQYQELSPIAQKKLFKFFFPKTPIKYNDGVVWEAFDVNPEYLTIGRLIGFLDDQDFELYKRDGDWVFSYNLGRINCRAKNLTDALWSACKEILEK